MKHNYYLKHGNVVIRPIDISDLELLRDWRNDRENSKFLSKIDYITSDMQFEWYQNSLTSPNEYVFAIDEVNSLKRCVGSISLYNITDYDAEVGKILVGDDEAHGKKVGVNSLKALLDIAFKILKLDKVYLHVYEKNVAAVKVYEQANFRVYSSILTANGVELEMVLEKMQ